MKLTISKEILEDRKIGESETNEKAKDKLELRWPMWPKIIQVNANDVYMTGGNDSSTDQTDFGDSKVLKTTLYVSLKDSLVS